MKHKWCIEQINILSARPSTFEMGIAFAINLHSGFERAFPVYSEFAHSSIASGVSQKGDNACGRRCPCQLSLSPRENTRRLASAGSLSFAANEGSARHLQPATTLPPLHLAVATCLPSLFNNHCRIWHLAFVSICHFILNCDNTIGQ